MNEKLGMPINAFRTNAQGTGKVSISLDFFLTDGAYPFPGGDVAVRTFQSYSVRLASQCSDGLLHGLLPGVHEPTFDGSL